MTSVSAHGGLEHKIMTVSSLTIEGGKSLIKKFSQTNNTNSGCF